MTFNTEALLQILAFINSFSNDSPRSESYIRHLDGNETLFRVESNIPFGVVRAESHDGSEYYEYDRSSGTYTLNSDGEKHIDDSRQFPSSPPLLGLLHPIDLPIWGGESSFYQPVGIDVSAPSKIAIEFGYRSGPEILGKLIIDLSTSSIQTLEMNSVTYERKEEY